MKESNLLAKFEVKGSKYAIYGNFDIKTSQDNTLRPYNYPEFFNLSAKRLIDGKEVDFHPKGCTWTGRSYVVTDMIQDCLAKAIQYSSLYSVSFLEERLQELVDSYHEEEDIVKIIDNKKIPNRILHDDMYTIYELLLITSQYIYYIADDQIVMLSTKTHELISDNYFASVGYDESLENVENGNETLIWGEIPKD